jgi:hypothetical protein
MTQAILVGIALQAVAMIAISFYYNHWFAKLLVIAYLTVLANAVYFAFDGVKGWPAEEPREVKGVIASIVIVNPSESSEGAIYVGVFLSEEGKWYEYDYPRTAPKTFYVRYSNNRAAQFEKAKQAMQEGKEVRINGIPPMEGQGEGEEYDGELTDISSIIGDMIAKLMPKQEDTYQPGNPKSIEIVEPGSPPSKGTSE